MIILTSLVGPTSPMLRTKVQGHWTSVSSQANGSKSTSFQNDVDSVPLACERCLGLQIFGTKGTKWTLYPWLANI